MHMLLAWIVLFTAIVAFFLDEFVRVLKKIFSIPGFKLFLPLLMASFIMERFAVWIWKGLTFFQERIADLVSVLSRSLPFQKGAVIMAHALIIFIMISIPLWVNANKKKKKPMFRAQYWTYLLSAVFGIMAVLLIV